jgi:hypothetical protein
MQVIGCRRQARRALQVGRPANQIARKFDEIVEFSGCAREQADTGYESRVASENPKILEVNKSEKTELVENFHRLWFMVAFFGDYALWIVGARVNELPRKLNV